MFYPLNLGGDSVYPIGYAAVPFFVDSRMFIFGSNGDAQVIYDCNRICSYLILNHVELIRFGKKNPDYLNRGLKPAIVSNQKVNHSFLTHPFSGFCMRF